MERARVGVGDQAQRVTWLTRYLGLRKIEALRLDPLPYTAALQLFAG